MVYFSSSRSEKRLKFIMRLCIGNFYLLPVLLWLLFARVACCTILLIASNYLALKTSKVGMSHNSQTNMSFNMMKFHCILDLKYCEVILNACTLLYTTQFAKISPVTIYVKSLQIIKTIPVVFDFWINFLLKVNPPLSCNSVLISFIYDKYIAISR